MLKRSLIAAVLVFLLSITVTYLLRPAAPKPASGVSRQATVPHSTTDDESLTVVRFPSPTSGQDHRNDYTLELLTATMAITQAEYGPFSIELASPMSRERQLSALKSGKSINLADSSASTDWSIGANAIEFPLRKGLQNHRLLLIHKDNREAFANVKTLQQLKSLSAGLHTQWQTTRVLSSQGFKVVTGDVYDGLFKMLDHKRFDYFPRALNEVFLELETRQDSLPNLMLEPRLALHIPSPTYFYVSKTEPKLRQRLEEGLWALHRSGELDIIFDKYHNLEKLRASLQGRQIFYIDNPLIPAFDKNRFTELWFAL